MFKDKTMTVRLAVILVCLLLAPGSSEQQQPDDPSILDSALRRDYPHGKSELVFLLDRSGSIGSDDFGVEVFFVESLLTEFSIGADATRVAVVSYSEDVVSPSVIGRASPGWNSRLGYGLTPIFHVGRTAD